MIVNQDLYQVIPCSYAYVVEEVFPWGGNSTRFSACALISRIGIPLNEIHIWSDLGYLNQFMVQQYTQK